jgi:two-component system, chemotaxis family, CheB/CheR fusion protein
VLREILALLRAHTGHDFSQYKRATLLRRIGRRMQVNVVIDLPTYLGVLRSYPDEAKALLSDLLISVTNFFRDRSVWQALETAIPSLFARAGASDQMRVWVVGCATGEEAYSIAMLLHEHASTSDQPPAIQVFATDIDEEAIAVARQGLYPDTIEADISPERLQRFFIAEQGYYQIKKEIRDLVLFAPHNLLRDPPFSKLDLITCHNLLIYLNRDVQEQILQLFHFVLRPEGHLLLGASESTDSVPSLSRRSTRASGYSSATPCRSPPCRCRRSR